MNTRETNRIIKELKAKIKDLQAELIEAKKREGIDPNIEVNVKKNQARRERVRRAGKEDRFLGHFYLAIEIEAEKGDVYVPLSVTSGKQTSGFKYYIEGGAVGDIVQADVTARGGKMSHVTVGTIKFAKIAAGSKVTFAIRSTIEGKPKKKYKIVITRLNYKTELAQARYHQYRKPIPAKSVQL